MRDREKRIDHEIENGIWNGERIIYSRIENGERRMGFRIKLSIEVRMELRI